ncbi:MAG: type II secretion system F family protein, partial [Cellulomonas sp.]
MATTARTYEYVVRDHTGKTIKARIEAQNQAAVANRLKTMGIAPLSISEVQSTGLHREISIPGFGASVKTKDLAIMARQLATMISAGLSILRALTILAEQTENQALAKVLAQVRGDVETGIALSDAMGRHKE